jgi:multiple sugar transport system substrate-binding protein
VINLFMGKQNDSWEEKMKSRNVFAFLTVLLLVSLLAVACGGAEATDTPAPAPTQAPEEPTAAPEEPTAAPEEPTTAPEEPTTAPEEPTQEAMMESCTPATDGPLAGVDPSGQTVVWWHQHSDSREERLLEMVADFNATNACGITVEATNQGGYDDIRDKMNAGIATGDLPGLVVGYQNDQAFYALADGLVDLNTYLNDETWGMTSAEISDFFPAFLQQGVHPAFGNQRLGFPPNRSVEGLYYNLTWLQELGFDGPPTTPDEFREMACAGAEANGDGTGGYILRDDASAVAAWTFAYGGDVLSADGQGYVYNGQATADALAFLKGMYDDGCAYFFTEGYPDPEFAARRAIFTQGSSSGLPFYASGTATVAEEEGREPDEWGFTAIPHTTPDPTIDIYGADVMIPSTTPETELAAWIFIKWFTSPEIQAEWVRASNYFPTRASTEEYLGDYISENPQWGQALSLLQYGVFEPQLISYQGVRDAAQQAFNEVMQGADIQATLDALTQEANDLQAELMVE